MSKRGENIRKRKDGRWEARYMKGRTREGKIRYGYIYGQTYEEVRMRKFQIQQKVFGRSISTKNMTMQQLFAEWLAATRHTIKESSFALYETVVETHLLPWFGPFKLRQVTTEMIHQFSMEKLRLDFAPRTVRCILIILRNVLGYGEEMGYLSMGDMQIHYPKIGDQPLNVMTENQIQNLVCYLEKEKSRFGVGILLCIYSGIRVGELCGLKWKDLDFENGIMKISRTVSRIKNLDYDQTKKENTRKNSQPKTVIMITTPKSASSVRDIPIPDFLLEKLLPYRGEDELFVLTGDDTCTEPRAVQRRFQAMLKLCGLPSINIHSLRHAFASRCAEMGFDSKTLSELLGHSSVKVTMDIYVHTTMRQKKNCINQLSF